MNRKNKNSLHRLLLLKKGNSVKALWPCLSLAFYLSSIMMPFVCVVCCVRALIRENQEMREMRAVSRGQRLCGSPCSIWPAWAQCVPAFFCRRTICRSKGVCVLSELRRVNLYTVHLAVLSIPTRFIVFLFPAVVQ